MKKKLVSIMLSIALCLSMTAPAGAAEFSSDETAATEAPADAGIDAASEEIPEDIFSSGETEEPGAGIPETPENPEEPEMPEEDFKDTAEKMPDEGFSTGVMEEDAEAAEAGSILVKAENWEKDGEHFKLRKPAVKETPQEVPEAEVPGTEAPEADVQNSGAEFLDAAEENAVAEDIMTEDVLPAETLTPAAGEISADEEIPPADISEDSLYYTERDGIIYVTTEYKDHVHKGYYLFDENGYLVTGQQTANTGLSSNAGEMELYFTDVTNAVLYSEAQGEEITPYTSNLGQQVRDDWVWTGTVFRYYDKNGKFLTVSQVDEIYKANGKYTGYYEIDGEYYCLEADGTPRTGEITLKVGSSSAKYYFQPAETAGEIPGKMYHDGWLKLKGKKGDRWLYYNQGVTNPKDIGKFLDRGTVATRLDTETMGDYTYLIDYKGYIIKSSMKKAANGSYYCTDSRGVVYKDKLVKYKNYRYYFASDGKRVPWKNIWRKCPGASNRYYYFGSTPGRVEEKKGWQKVTNTKGNFYGWFYFNSSGNHYMNKLTSSGYYFTSTGKLASGSQEINGKMYMFAPSDEKTHRGKMYKDTLIHLKNRWYYADEDGVLKKEGWEKIDGGYYYFSNYKALTNRFIKKNGVNGYLSSTGRYTTGWVLVSNSKNLVRYIDPDGNGFVNNGSKWIDGLLYYFDKNGYRITDLTNIYKKPYYFAVDRVNGVMTVYNAAKTVPVKTIRVSVGLSSTPTPLGTYRMTPYGRWQSLMGPSWGQYGTHVDGAGQGGIFVHSVASPQMNAHNLPADAYNRLGSPASHGCIRTCVADAKWVYENCGGGTIRIFDGKYNKNECMKGPLGRRALVPLRYPYNFDPTDPSI